MDTGAGGTESTPLAVVVSRARRRLIVGVLLVLALGLMLAACGTKASLTPAQRLNAGLAASERGNDRLARTDYENVLKQPRSNKGLNKIAWYDLGVLDQKLGNTSAAISEYQQAILIDPKYTFALFNLGILETRTNSSAAISFYLRALATAPENAGIRWNLGLLLYQTGHLAQGRSYMQSAIRIDPAYATRLPKGVRL
jgi:tetratricopeptide (TPR) repeat protein